MTPTQGLLSVAIIWHIVAMVVGAVPSLEDYGSDTTPPRVPKTTLQSRATAALDQIAVPAVRLHRVVYAVTRPLHGPVHLYLDLTDQFSSWNMFSSPSRATENVRLDYVVVQPDGSRHLESELVYPAAEPGEWRVVAAYFASFVDKAFANGTESYQKRALQARQLGQPAPVAAMNEDLLPFIRYYTRRHEHRLPKGTRVERTEYWRGSAASPAPGQALPVQILQARQRTLERLRQPGTLPSLPSRKDDDITWTLWTVNQVDGR
jgi:hypothetical protein